MKSIYSMYVRFILALFHVPINYFLNILGQNRGRAIKAQKVSCGGEGLVATSW